MWKLIVEEVVERDVRSSKTDFSAASWNYRQTRTVSAQPGANSRSEGRTRKKPYSRKTWHSIQGSSKHGKSPIAARLDTQFRGHPNTENALSPQDLTLNSGVIQTRKKPYSRKTWHSIQGSSKHGKSPIAARLDTQFRGHPNTEKAL